MKRKLKVVILILIMFVTVQPSFAEDKRDILIIHSYYQHFPWTNNLQTGIEKVLNVENVDYYLEYLDEHRLSGDRSFEDLYTIITNKYGNKSFDYIVVADNFAYNFLSEYKDSLFVDVPIILVGINNMKEDMIFKEEMTGVAQTVSHSKMLGLIEDLHPSLSHLVIAGSDNATGQNEAQSYKRAVTDCSLMDKTEFVTVEHLDELFDKLSKYDSNTVVIITSLIHGKTNTMNLGPQYISNIIDKTHLPVYVAVDVMMGYEGEGAVGGYIVDGEIHGALVANMVNELLKGKNISEIPIQWEPIVTPQFNYKRLMQFNIDMKSLPEGSIILGKPVSSRMVSDGVLLTYVVVMIVLGIISALLIYLVISRKKAEKDLLVKQVELEKSNEILLVKNKEIDYLANNDSVTNFHNRQHFIKLIDQLLSDDTCMIMYAIYVRNIKQVDDAYGYKIGDDARLEISNKIRRIFEKTNKLFARYYDTYYVIDYDDKACDRVEGTINSLEKKLQENITVRHYDIELNIKLGIVKCDGNDTGIELLQKADITVLNALLKDYGVSEIYHHSFKLRLEEKLAMEMKMKRAIKAKAFTLHFQPQIDIESQKVVSCEALIRWQDEDESFISPNVFIPLAEEIGVIREIGDWVIQEACRILNRWELDGIKCPMSINVSAKQINDDLPLKLKAAIDENQIDPRNLLIEITETAVMDDRLNNIRIIKEVSELGIGIALDDFGIGHSSLKYIMDFPIDKLKIDKLFIDEIVNPEQGAIVKAMKDLGDVFNYKVIAEGVEKNEQVDIVKGLGINEIQGWYYSKALEEEAFRSYFSQKNNEPAIKNDSHISEIGLKL